jgi:hypothetical protein
VNKYRIILLVFLGAIVIGIGLLIVSFVSVMKPDNDKEEQVRIQADQYLEDNFNENFEVYDTLFDNMDNYFEFDYAAKVRDKNTNTNFLVYYDDITRQMVDTYIANKWADDLSIKIRPFIKEHFGETTDFHVFFDEIVSNKLDIDPINPKSYTEFDVAPDIQITVPRKKSDEDARIVNEFIAFLQSEVKLQSGSVSMDYIAENGVNLDDEWSKEF